jgi:hypothetical protein
MTGFLVSERCPFDADRAWHEIATLFGPELNEVNGARPAHLGAGDLMETTTSLEPPFRRTYEITGRPIRRYEGVIEFIPDGEGCQLRWQTTIEAADPSDETFAALVSSAEAAVRRTVAAVASANG